MPQGVIKVDPTFEENCRSALAELMALDSSGLDFQKTVADRVLEIGGIPVNTPYTGGWREKEERTNFFRMALRVLGEYPTTSEVDSSKIIAISDAISRSIDALDAVSPPAPIAMVYTEAGAPPPPTVDETAVVKPQPNWLYDHPHRARYLGYLLLGATVAVLAMAALPPAGLFVAGSQAALAWKIVAPLFVTGFLFACDGQLCPEFMRRLDRFPYAFLLLSSVLLGMALSFLVVPAMPVVLGGVMSAVAWQLLAALSFAFMVLGAERLLHAFNHPPADHWRSKLWYAGKVVLGVVLMAPAFIFMMPGTMLAIAVKAGVSGVLTASASAALSSVTMQSIVIGAAITAAFMSGVQLVGALSVSISVSFKAIQWTRWAAFFRWMGITQMVAGVAVPLASLHAVFAVSGNAMLHAARTISHGLAIGSQAMIESGRTAIQSLSAALPSIGVFFGELFGVLIPPSVLGGATAASAIELEHEIYDEGFPVPATGGHAVYRRNEDWFVTRKQRAPEDLTPRHPGERQDPVSNC